MAGIYKRGKTYYTLYYVGGKKKRISLQTSSLQIAKEKIRQIESNLMRGEEDVLSTRTPLSDILNRYVEHIRLIKTPKSAQTDIYYLRQMFGPICPSLEKGCLSWQVCIREEKRFGYPIKSKESRYAYR